MESQRLTWCLPAILFSFVTLLLLSEYRHWRCGLRGTVVPASVTSRCLVLSSRAVVAMGTCRHAHSATSG